MGKGGRKRKRETSMCERNIDGLPLARPNPGTWPTLQACALTRNQTSDLLVCGMTPNPLCHTSQGPFHIFINILIAHSSHTKVNSYKSLLTPCI